MTSPTSDTRYQPELNAAIEAARQAGDVLRDDLHRPTGPRGADGKAPADFQAGALIDRILREVNPNYGLIIEEGAASRDAQDAESHVWLVDPNDGTRSYIKGHRGPAVSIALLRAGEPVLGVVFAYAFPDAQGDLIAWARGCGPITRNGAPAHRQPFAQRLEGEHTILVSQDGDRKPLANGKLVEPARFRTMPSVAYRLALVAVGDAEAGNSINGPIAYDVAGGHALLKAAGGELYRIGSGRPVTYNAEGHGMVGDCIGGGPIAQSLAQAPWQSALHRSDEAIDPGPFDLTRPIPDRIVTDAARLSRAQGCLLGQCVGDALGALVEFQSAASVRRAYPDGVTRLVDGGTHQTLAGQPTDDSELALLLARAIVHAGGYDEETVARAYGWWRDSKPFDIGGTTAAAFGPARDALLAGEPVAPAARAGAERNADASKANGGLMRISPLAIFAAGADLAPDALADLARIDARLSHAHPVCQDANAVFVVALAHAITTGANAAEVYQFAAAWAEEQPLHAEVRHAVNAAAEGPPDYATHSRLVTAALRNAFFQLLHAPGFEAGVRATVEAGEDADTNGAIAGALLGAVHGRDAIPQPWRDRVLTCRPMAGLQATRRPRPRALWPVDALLLAEHLLTVG